MRLRPHTHGALLRQIHSFCKNEIPHQAKTTTVKQRSSGTAGAWLLSSRPQTVQKLFARRGDHPTRRCIVLPSVMKCKRVCNIFLQIVNIVSREGSGEMAPRVLAPRVDSDQPRV